MERLTKLVVTGWIIAALAFEARLVSGAWPQLPLLMVVLTLTLALASAFTPRAVSAVLLLSYPVPVVVGLTHGGPHYAPFEIVWLAPLLGAMLPDLLRTRWHIPARWRAPLVAGALVVCTCAPIVVLRETDFTPGVLFDREQWSFVGAVWPSLTAAWVAYVAITLVIGVLWFDWLCGRPAATFRRDIVTPLVVSASVLIGVALYQQFVDIGFLNESAYGALRRAGGTMYDANLSGVVAALWIGGVAVWADRFGAYRVPFALLAGAVIWAAIWGTASGTGLAAAFIVTAFTIADLWRRFALRPWHLAALTAAGLAVVAMVLLSPGDTISPVARLRDRLAPGNEGIAARVVSVVWTRDGYGTSADAMIRQYPLSGVGVGMYHSLASTYANTPVAPDNAQNWIRHQLAEMGVLGSAPWLLWFLLFAGYVLRWRRRDVPGTITLRGIITAFGAVSMLGMPGQDVIVVITFWVFANWLRLSAGSPDSARLLGPWSWGVVGAIVLLAAAATGIVGASELRPPLRAQQATAPYSYGIGTADARGFRPAAAHAVAVLDRQGRWIAVTVRHDAADATVPLDIRVTVDGRSIVKGRFSSNVPLTGVLELPDDARRILLEADGSRGPASRMSSRFSSTPVYAISWEFSDAPPGRGADHRD